jgi:hypothetical protein
MRGPRRSQPAQEPLALPQAEVNFVMVTQMSSEQFAIPMVLGVAQLARAGLEILAGFRPDRSGQPSGPASARAFSQRGTAAGSKSMHPPLKGGWMLAQPSGHGGAPVALANQQHGVQPVVVTGFRRAAHFPPQGDRRRWRLGNLQGFHAPEK